MAQILFLIAIGVFVLIGIQIYNARRNTKAIEASANKPVTDSSAALAASALRDLENARAELRGEYPALHAMFGGYLNEHSINEAGGIEGAVKEMIADWTARREEVGAEIVRLLSQTSDEEEVRAIMVSLCDAEFETEGYRNWLTWLLGQFNAIS